MTAWPWPHDTAIVRRERVAASYRALLEDIAPDVCHELDAQMLKVGQRWVVPQVVTWTDDDWLSADQVASHASVNVKTAYEWRARGLRSIRRNEGIRFRFGDLREWLAGNRRP